MGNAGLDRKGFFLGVSDCAATVDCATPSSTIRATTSSILATTVNKMRRIKGAIRSSSNVVRSIDSQEMSMTALKNSAAGGNQLLYGSSTHNLISTTSQPPKVVETLQIHVNQLQHIEGTQ
ncbi:hypothetical protein QYF36_017410 [Acer negundo]|nr:hypothetical protein QYF36_017410 [Acer negundo]